jgi:hypothetical protein
MKKGLTMPQRSDQIAVPTGGRDRSPRACPIYITTGRIFSGLLIKAIPRPLFFNPKKGRSNVRNLLVPLTRIINIARPPRHLMLLEGGTLFPDVNGVLLIPAEHKNP